MTRRSFPRPCKSPGRRFSSPGTESVASISRPSAAMRRSRSATIVRRRPSRPQFSLRARNDLLDEHCADLGRDAASLERAYFFGWAIEQPFVSAESLRDYIGRYGDAGTERFVFSFARQSPDGAALTRENWESFAGDVLASAVSV